jgi:hypothetical protein
MTVGLHGLQGNTEGEGSVERHNIKVPANTSKLTEGITGLRKLASLTLRADSCSIENIGPDTVTGHWERHWLIEGADGLRQHNLTFHHIHFP